ncbi:MAG: hypothetical protein HIU84_12305 [Acidobacteria bacterium]|nr:hypothetical protein [Acidobacteriota bacterium]
MTDQSNICTPRLGTDLAATTGVHASQVRCHRDEPHFEATQRCRHRHACDEPYGRVDIDSLCRLGRGAFCTPGFIRGDGDRVTAPSPRMVTSLSRSEHYTKDRP